jgi:hypothetical protein
MRVATPRTTMTVKVTTILSRQLRRLNIPFTLSYIQTITEHSGRRPNPRVVVSFARHQRSHSPSLPRSREAASGF